MDAMKVIYTLIAVDVMFIVMISVLILLIPEKIECDAQDKDCLSTLMDIQENCRNTESTITIGNETNYVKILVKVYWDGTKCVTEETVIEDHNSGVAPMDITGYKTECDSQLNLLETYGSHACNGSLIGYLSPGESTSDSGDSGSDDDYIYQAYCSLNGQECKEEVSDYIKNCRPADIVLDMMVNNTQGGVSYWTLFIQVRSLPVEYTETKKIQPRCEIYNELINAVNLPPEIPPDVIGDSMTCTIPLSEFPISSIPIVDCEGELVEYIHMIYD